jgi:hypothetical protein
MIWQQIDKITYQISQHIVRYGKRMSHRIDWISQHCYSRYGKRMNSPNRLDITAISIFVILTCHLYLLVPGSLHTFAPTLLTPAANEHSHASRMKMLTTSEHRWNCLQP